MARKVSVFERRFPYAGLFLLIAVVLSIPLTVWSLNHRTNTTNYAAQGSHGKPGSGGSSSLSVVMVTDNNNDGLPNWGDTITYSITTDQTQYPYVTTSCYQNGTLMMSAWAGFYDSYPWPGARNIPLLTDAWKGGAADCTAGLLQSTKHNGTQSFYTTINFHVSP